MNKQTVGEYRNLHRIIDDGGYRNGAPIAISCRDLRIRRQFGRRVDRQRHAVVPWMIHSLLNLDVKLLSADGLAHNVARLTPVGVGAPTWSGFLRITQIVFDEPRSRFQQLEMS